MIRTDIGEMVISIKKNGSLSEKKINYVFTPSFENLSQLGEPFEIINAYTVLLSNQAYEAITRFKELNHYVTNYINEKLTLQLNVARKVLTCCCSADVTQLLGSKNKKGLIPIHDILLIARSLLEYGVAGRAKVRISQRNENKSYSSEFKITDYINNARVHLGLSLDDAKKLTMTEYIMLMANKYPDKDGFTREEYDKTLADYEKRRRERLAKA
ncbi:hypothetical protein J3U21_11460, partial [Gilliamella sp. B2776]